MKRASLTHVFVEFIPEHVEEGVLYVSMAYATAVHLCACGCGSEIVTSFSPTDWRLSFNGETVSLEPSIGNWSLPCRSHYWINNDRIRWAGPMSQKRIDAGRAYDRTAKATYYGDAPPEAEKSPHSMDDLKPTIPARPSGKRPRG
jgi:hypothetical protein